MTEPAQILDRGPRDEQTIEEWFREMAESLEEIHPSPHDEERVERTTEMLMDCYTGDESTFDKSSNQN